MTSLLRQRVVAVVVGALVLVGLGYGAAVATGAGTPTAVHVCVTRTNVVVGAVRGGKCPKGSHKISVGTQGPRGATGATGAVGPTGPAGPQGPQGAPGPGADLLGTNTSFAAAGHGAECTLGDVWLTAGSVASGVPAAGQTLSISMNTALFSLLGTTYGGNGTTTFQLPDLRQAAPNGLTYVICMAGVYPIRN